MSNLGGAMVRTSQSHPLQIAEAPCGSGGVIGLTLCPGKCGPSVFGSPWARDLQLDLEAVRAWAPDAVVTLMESGEFAELGVADLPAALERDYPNWHHLPIRDLDIPDARFERLWVYSGHVLRALLREGGRVLVHCRGGLGRTGMIAARLLVELGAPADEAIAKVRAARPGAIETQAQQRHVEQCCPVLYDVRRADQILGCLFGGALGDAFGFEVEFKSLAAIRARFGDAGLQTAQYCNDKLVVSDDTQMTLFTAAGLVAAVSDQLVLEPERIVSEMRRAYLDWLDTQSGPAPPNAEGFRRYAVLWARRAPGATCLSALRQGARGAPDRPVNDSKGCGGVMRVAPIGLLPALSADDSFEIAKKAAALTHGHPSGFLSAASLAGLIRDLLGDPSVETALSKAERRLMGADGGGETLRAMRQAISAVKQAQPSTASEDLEALRSLGEGWVGEEALAIGLYAALRDGGFAEVLKRAANHDGDSDSTASIAGQIWGVVHGVCRMPVAWIRRLDVLEPLCEIAGRLIDCMEAESAATLAPRLQALARHAPVLETLGSGAATHVPAERSGSTIALGSWNYPKGADAFIADLHDYGWVRPFDWPTWARSPEGQSFARGAAAVHVANHAQLRRYLTTVVRNDRYCDGILAEAFERGEMTAVARRAQSLLAGLADGAPEPGKRGQA